MKRCDDAGDVGTGGKRPDDQIPVSIHLQNIPQMVKIRRAVEFFAEDSDIDTTFFPGGLIGMMLHVGDDHQRTFFFTQSYFVFIFFRYSQTEDALEFIYHRRHSKPCKEQDIIF